LIREANTGLHTLRVRRYFDVTIVGGFHDRLMAGGQLPGVRPGYASE
jgi:hypothetical protein